MAMLARAWAAVCRGMPLYRYPNSGSQRLPAPSTSPPSLSPCFSASPSLVFRYTSWWLVAVVVRGGPCSGPDGSPGCVPHGIFAAALPLPLPASRSPSGKQARHLLNCARCPLAVL
ncbi:hypothetical protein NDU88_003069 [Pleurodeles waltl]|uniref:Uncharacterized protein n=1 Tax=Pleurodeles waltl TaxID=8319 RepID=A0AAV7P905_PLEWA|nr:hypothetical protein NDU88_003069 [Pleurodeles waltl]